MSDSPSIGDGSRDDRPPGEDATPPDPSEITRLLHASDDGSDDARDQLLRLVYAELHAMARQQIRGERPGHTLSATALVNEAYLKLFRQLDARPSDDDGRNATHWSGRRGFYAAAAMAMRRILIDHARARVVARRGGTAVRRRDRVPLDVLQAVDQLDPEDLLSLDEAITRLSSLDERAADVVRMRFYAGLPQPAIAEMLGVNERTIKRDWQFARAWLHKELQGDEGPSDSES